MTLDLAVRALGLVAAGVLSLSAGSGARRFALVLLPLSVFGLSPCPLPGWAGAGAAFLVLGVIAALFVHGTWPPLVVEAASRTAVLGVSGAVVAAIRLRQQGDASIVLGVLGTAAALSLFGAEASRANADAGWRRGAGWFSAVAGPAALAALAAWLVGETPPGRRALLGTALAVAAFAAWLPAALAEWGRAKRELAEEVTLGLLPAEDAALLAVPWKRRFSAPHFGRADERREYVRSALLLAVARHQQVRRSGEAQRLRQLEVITFRTRIRRTLLARAQRMSGVATPASGEFPMPDVLRGSAPTPPPD